MVRYIYHKPTLLPPLFKAASRPWHVFGLEARPIRWKILRFHGVAGGFMGFHRNIKIKDEIMGIYNKEFHDFQDFNGLLMILMGIYIKIGTINPIY